MYIFYGPSSINISLMDLAIYFKNIHKLKSVLARNLKENMYFGIFFLKNVLQSHVYLTT